ncbi:50S ribosomal protein L29 [Halobacteriovorax sp. GB3]|uniref:50S ribosomal protein L29 n=1 Tax=Halobacteriovorax sp. GB3 TaxID=2719615 RepID=UPI002361013D|nr:50S ribosomal protein L29 [Halobacteriovorax sp. GB3]MDD0854500.1 50S ribosomal protein L29 [Halobacteriovorax sp. GB3]
MQRLKIEDIKGWDAKQIDAKTAEMRKALFDYRMQKSTSGLEKPHLIKIAKKNIARLLTAKNAKGDK